MTTDWNGPRMLLPLVPAPTGLERRLQETLANPPQPHFFDEETALAAIRTLEQALVAKDREIAELRARLEKR